MLCMIVSRPPLEEHVQTYVEVGQDDKQTTILGSQHILSGNYDIVEGDIGCPGSGGVRSLDLLGLDILGTRDEEGSEAAVGL